MIETEKLLVDFVYPQMARLSEELAEDPTDEFKFGYLHSLVEPKDYLLKETNSK